MTSSSVADTVWQIIRYLLIAAGGWAAGKGYVTSDQVTAIVGSLGSLFAAAWGIYVKFNTVPVAASTGERQNVTVVSSATGQPVTK
jgi:uncharacterized membrane protein YraQ (UPF0718 family)